MFGLARLDLGVRPAVDDVERAALDLVEDLPDVEPGDPGTQDDEAADDQDQAQRGWSSQGGGRLAK